MNPSTQCSWFNEASALHYIPFDDASSSPLDLSNWPVTRKAKFCDNNSQVQSPSHLEHTHIKKLLVPPFPTCDPSRQVFIQTAGNPCKVIKRTGQDVVSDNSVCEASSSPAPITLGPFHRIKPTDTDDMLNKSLTNITWLNIKPEPKLNPPRIVARRKKKSPSTCVRVVESEYSSSITDSSSPLMSTGSSQSSMSISASPGSIALSLLHQTPPTPRSSGDRLSFDSKSAETPCRQFRYQSPYFASQAQLDKVNEEYGKDLRPPFSYVDLIAMAIRSSPEGMLTLQEIYKWIEKTFVYYRSSPKPGWKNSIRHNLSLYNIFERKKLSPATPGQTKASYWSYLSNISPKPKNKKPVPHKKVVPPKVRKKLVKDSQKEPGKPPYRNTWHSRKGPAPLLPKLPPNAFALIPVHGFLPMVTTVPQPSLGNMEQTKKSRKRPKTFSTTRNAKQIKIVPKPPDPVYQTPNVNIDSSAAQTRMECDSLITLPAYVNVNQACNQELSGAYMPLPFENYRSNPNSESLGMEDSGMGESSGNLSQLTNINSAVVQSRRAKPRILKRSHAKLKQYCDQENNISICDSMVNQLERQFSSPMRNLLKTPPRSTNNKMSTPKGMFSSRVPLWGTPIKGITPLKNLENVFDSGVYTTSGSKVTVTPTKRTRPVDASLGSSPKLGVPLLISSSPNFSGFDSPKFSSPKFFGSPNESSFPGKRQDSSPLNSSLNKVFADFHFENFLEEAFDLPIDMSNLSWNSTH